MLYSPEASKQYSVVLDTLHKKQLHLRRLFMVSVWSSWCMVAFCWLFFSLITGTKTEFRSVICGWMLIFKNCNGCRSGGLFHWVGKYHFITLLNCWRSIYAEDWEVFFKSVTWKSPLTPYSLRLMFHIVIQSVSSRKELLSLLLLSLTEGRGKWEAKLNNAFGKMKLKLTAVSLPEVQ